MKARGAKTAARQRRPARATAQVLDMLRVYESRNVTFIEEDGSWPIVWERARGTNVWDADGRKYLDLTAAFGVAAAGHANPAVVRAGQKQMGRLLHAMGDVHPHAGKAQLARELSEVTYGRWSKRVGKAIFCNSGFEAVEAALKTALLATGRPGVIAFEGAYHGLGYGALTATHRSHFRAPFKSQLPRFVAFAPFPCGEAANEIDALEERLHGLFERNKVGAILVEPVQARGGIRIPPPEFLPMLRRVCDEHDALLVLDEIYTGFGRTGRWFACEHFGVVPDLICLGKALTGGFPLSACVGRADLMDAAWPPSTGEALHTSTFLGHPVGCAMALANITEIRRHRLVQQSARTGAVLLRLISEIAASVAPPLKASARGLGLMAGLELTTHNGTPATEVALGAMKEMLARGYVMLPEGEHGNILSFTPPLVISERELERSVSALGKVLQSVASVLEMPAVQQNQSTR